MTIEEARQIENRAFARMIEGVQASKEHGTFDVLVSDPKLFMAACKFRSAACTEWVKASRRVSVIKRLTSKPPKATA